VDGLIYASLMAMLDPARRAPASTHCAHVRTYRRPGPARHGRDGVPRR
jgi:hypothetical protein